MNSRAATGMSAFGLVASLAVGAAAGQMNHEQHMKGRAAQAMGFDQARTTHHFRLKPDGGTIEVTVKDPADTALRDQIAAHLEMIAGQFSRGDFDTPFAVHGETPAGVPAMKRQRAQITYTFEPEPSGGRVVITTTSDRASAAVHDFLRYQIREHHTGDSTDVERR
jgi:hypothetical protein